MGRDARGGPLSKAIYRGRIAAMEAQGLKKC